MLRKKMALVFCAVLLCAGGVSAAYIEGTDTTDVNGYGLDSAFRVSGTNINGQNIVRYWFDEGSATGYFKNYFDDIKMAPSSIRQPFSLFGASVYYCFVIKKNKDSTYSKVKLLQLISGNRYLYRYGTNTTPNNRMLANPAYDPSIRYKPNNFCNFLGIIYPPAKDTAFWEAPLPNNNHLIGYIYYRAKSGVTIDTTAPINLAQWDSVAFVNATWSTQFSIPYVRTRYFNLVAVYTEGKSDFLLGWTMNNYSLDGVKQGSPATTLTANTIEVRRADGGILITLQPSLQTTGSTSLSIYNVNGVKVAGFSDFKNNQVFWKTTDRNIAEGQYIVKLELPDKSVISRTLVFSRK